MNIILQWVSHTYFKQCHHGYLFNLRLFFSQGLLSLPQANWSTAYPTVHLLGLPFHIPILTTHYIITAGDHLPTSTLYHSPVTLHAPFTTSTNLLWGLPLSHLPSSSTSNTLCPIYQLSLLFKCSIQLKLASLTLSPKCRTRAVYLLFSFLILSWSFLVKISASSALPPPAQPPLSLLVLASPNHTSQQVSLLSCKHSLDLLLHLLLQIIPHTPLRSLHPTCTRFFTSLKCI